MHFPPHNADLSLVVDLMRNLSMQTDPQQAAHLYGMGLRKLNIVPNDRYLSLSRRGLRAPNYRITRNSSWKDAPNPWTQTHKLPHLSGGLLADILYSNQPHVIPDLQDRLQKSDPAWEYLHDMQLLVALPHYDNGESINYGVLLNHTAEKFPFKDIPMMIWQANLWGRATLNLVNQQKLQVANTQMDRELKVVADIQRSLLPRDIPHVASLEIAAHYETSQRAGGDYYDFFPLPDNQWGILIADVSGHGTPAAVLMAITHAIAHARPGDPTPPEELLAFVNEKLAAIYTSNNGNFVTAFYAIYDTAARTLSYSSAGHPPPRLVRRHKIVPMEGENSLPLGIHTREKYICNTIELHPQDHLLLYTDGIIETFDPDGDIFGVDRLDAACLSAPKSPGDFLHHILAAVQSFSHSAPPTDDRTAIALRLT